ncbi:MAG TPA: hypothetical protein DEB21_09795 [Rhodospirillaceae bacterium]|nr:hypothetical protein [Rhodospirillaceae bacterium]
MVAEFSKAASLLLSLCLLYAFIAQRWPNEELTGKILSGLLFGVICVIGMEAPVTIAPGVIFDPRSVIISLSGVFGGPVGGAIAAVIAGGYRAYLGGGGAPVGVAVVVTCVALGIGYRAAYKSGRVPLNWLTLLVFGLIVHVVVIGLFTQLPTPVAEKVMQTVALPFVVAFTPATMVLGMILAYIDDRIETRRALAVSEARLQSVIDNGPNAMTLKDKDGKILLANSAYADWVGLKPAALIGKTMRDIFPADDARVFMEIDREVLASGEISIQEVARTFPKAGLRQLRNHKIPILLDAENDHALITIMVDITEERAVQQELRHALALAEDANLAKTQFLATMSHELRTPLNSIIGFSDILVNETFGTLNVPQYKEYAGDINDAGKHLLQLINDLLDLARIERGQMSLNEQRLDLRLIVNSCHRLVRERALEAGVSLMIDCHADLPPLMADELRVKQALVNLLSNAIKFTEQGGAVSVVARQQDDGAIRLTVSDTGIGISPEDMAVALSEFGQVDGSLTRKHEGTGLGLTLSRKLIELHGGVLEMESEVGRGTSAHLVFPVARSLPQPDAS